MPTINDISTQEGTRVPTRRTVPQPDGVRTPAEFVALMRHLQRWSGLTLPELEARMVNAPVLLPGGLAGMLGGSTLPHRELVSAFITACGCVPEVRADWMRAYAEVASPSPGPGPLPTAEPATALEPSVPPSPEKAQPEEQAKQHRPRHRKNSGKRRHLRTRSLSPLVAAPAFITVVVIAVAMFTALDGPGEKENRRSGELSASGSAPPNTGWYFVQPETAVSAGNCLTILPDDQFTPTLSQDGCDEEDRLQRMRFESHSNGTYTVQAHTNKDQLWCLTLDGPNDGARLHLSACDSGSKWQRFTLERAKPQARTTPDKSDSQPAPLYNLRSPETRQDDMCVGIDSSHPGTVHAVHTACTKTTIWGYTLVPTMAPAGT
jgi:hypothetical protein